MTDTRDGSWAFEVPLFLNRRFGGGSMSQQCSCPKVSGRILCKGMEAGKEFPGCRIKCFGEDTGKLRGAVNNKGEDVATLAHYRSPQAGDPCDQPKQGRLPSVSGDGTRVLDYKIPPRGTECLPVVSPHPEVKK